MIKLLILAACACAECRYIKILRNISLRAIKIPMTKGEF